MDHLIDHAPVPQAGTTATNRVPRTAPLAGRLAAILAGVLHVDPTDVPAEANFFEDLGADSMVMAQFCARVRKQPDLPTVSIKDAYQHPTVAALADALDIPVTPPPLQTQLTDILAGVLHVDPTDVPAEANFFEDLGADSMVMAQFCARVRKQPDLPTVSIKDAYQHPTVAALADALDIPVTPPPLQTQLTDILAGVLHVDPTDVPAEANFFEDLGADSMVMAQFCARVRKQPDLPTVSIKDVYQHQTITGLGTALAGAAPAAAPRAHRTPAPVPERVPAAVPPAVPVADPVTTGQYVLCGALQLLIFCAYAVVVGVVFDTGLRMVWAGTGVLDAYLRSVAFGAAVFVTTCLLPILVKWVLIGRWKPQEIRVWTLAYVRFWLVKTLVVANPLVLFAGSPLYTFYLRALGAKVGRDVVVFSRHAPVCTDLLTIGDGTLIEKDSWLNCYRAVSGVIQTGPVTIGSDVFVGDKAILDIHTSLGDGSQLGHASSLHAGQAVPAGERWHGSPGEPTDSNYRLVASARCGTWRRARYALLQLAYLLVVVLPVAFGGVARIIEDVPWLSKLATTDQLHVMNLRFWEYTLGASLVLYLGGMLLGLLVVMTAPRVLNRALTPGRTYPLFGFHYACQRGIERITNRRFFHLALGDSSYVVPYLRGLGYRLTPVVQTGSNLGDEFKHDNPFLTAIGQGTVIAGGLSVLTTNYSATSFSVSRGRIGPHSFLGNLIVYPAQGRAGENCLIATKALVPIDGEVRTGVGLLGSPAFEIPRTVQRDSVFMQMAHDEDFPRRLAAKNRHNLVSIGLLLLSRWVYTFALLAFVFGTADVHARFGGAAIAALEVLLVVFSILYFTLVERLSTGFRGNRPARCSIYERRFWQTERFWKLTVPPVVYRLAAGTPFKAVVWRLAGVHVGRQLFDDGAAIVDRNLVTLGDHVTLNVESVIQCHSQEDYAFKSDPTAIGSRCTVGTAALVHYGVTMDEGAVLAPDSFLMKGEEVPAHAVWGGNPAEELVAGPGPTAPSPVAATAQENSSGGALAVGVR